MGFMKPKVQPDQALEAQKAAERATKLDQTQQSLGDDNMRLFQIFGRKSLLSGGASGLPGAQGSLGKGTL